MTLSGGFRRHPVWASLALAALVLAGTSVAVSAGRGPGDRGSSTAGPAVSGSLPTSRHPVTDVAYGPLPVQQLDISYPHLGLGPFPAVVYAHSGGWTGGSRAAVPGQIAQLTSDGVAVVSIDYRTAVLAPDGRWENVFPTAQEDLDRAIRFVRANAGRYGLEAGMILVAGDSAGGHMALMAGAAPGVFADPTLTDAERAVSPVVEGVIDYAGPSDFASFADSGPWATFIMTTYLGCPVLNDASSCDPEVVAEASIATHLDPHLPPAYLAYGGRDTLVLPATQGRPVADGWARARGDDPRSSAPIRAVWYEESADATHALDAWTGDAPRLNRWIDLVLDHSV